MVRSLGQVIATCAWGAAIEAGYHPDAICEQSGVCPACDATHFTRRHYDKPFVMLITHLNDVHQWTRERIADWVATVEPADDGSARPEAADAVREDVGSPIVPLREKASSS
jgi:hypothetical protein